MASEFPSGLFYTNVEAGYDVVMRTIKTGATFRSYALVVQDVSGGASDGTIDEVGADPALILGIVMSAAVDANSPYESGKAPVLVIRPDYSIGLASAGSLVMANQGKDYGITKSAAGNWRLDIAKTGASARFHVVRVDLDRQIAWGHFLAANLQSDAIAS